MSGGPLKVLISAGESSGDRLGGELARAILRRRPDARILGMGGSEMAEAGVRIVQDLEAVSVVGIVEVLAHLGEIRAAMARLVTAVRDERPDVVVPIDFPDFNLRLAARIRSTGTPVCYFVSPQVWAWRRGRVRGIREVVRRMLVLFPFETAFYESAGVPVTFVGHPVVDRVPPEIHRPDLLERAGLDPARPVVALAPGSRRGEIGRMLPPMLDAAAELYRDRPELRFLISRARGVRDEVARSIDAGIEARGLRDVVRVHAGDYPAVVSACTAGIVASGTATLEAAMTGLPMVVAYKLAAPTYWIARRFVRLPHVAMPNLVAGREVVPERIQGACRGDVLAADVARYLDDPERVRRVRDDLADVRRRLGAPGACERAAEAVLEVADAARAGRPEA